MIDAVRDGRESELRDDLEILEEYLNGVPLPPLEFELVWVGGAPPRERAGDDDTFPGITPPSDLFDEDLPEEEPLPEPGPEHPQPITTSTMAEIYVSQGFIQKAIDIYAQILNESPGNQAVIRRIDELSAMLLDQETGDTGPSPPIPAEAQTPEPGSDRVLQTLERWLDNIRRRR